MPSISEIIKTSQPEFGPYEELYKHFHQNPELSFQEKETAARIVQELEKLHAYEIHANIGGHGIAAVLRNGPGKTILLRADIDALPVEEKTNVPYASTKTMIDSTDGVEKPTMHACGHDIHITALLMAAATLSQAQQHWSGTLLLIFQPAEERAGGARAMISDNLYTKVPIPDIALGGHVMPFRSGIIGTKRGLIASSADSFQLDIPGRQAHASTPHVGVDPIVQAASTILRLQTIVAREVDPSDFAVVTVSAIHAGDAENIIPSSASLKLNVRAAIPSTRSHILSSISRIIDAEAVASNAPAPPILTPTTNFPFLYNDAHVTAALERTFSTHFGVDRYSDAIPRLQGSEDFGILAESVGKPCCFFLYGGLEREMVERLEGEGRRNEIPGNHSPFFLPVVESVRVGCEGYCVGALTFLGKGEGV
ncbi:metal-dependent amidase/aminoacylase/carboxypeptidase [Periconia macrospinosa]|uniref:Metal-dependent amidase/aminoacylase/carboxypeptidase n=1 Tax=Periconia macrospinosa TaxID=97972 RepID=A0A2V1DYA6_9PLEO|nr:metal-dependent amidase/aminoacylase/carboxypeptidase [Periconia macrospinosa]